MFDDIGLPQWEQYRAAIPQISNQKIKNQKLSVNACSNVGGTWQEGPEFWVPLAFFTYEFMGDFGWLSLSGGALRSTKM